jgi:hypothetical protein
MHVYNRNILRTGELLPNELVNVNNVSLTNNLQQAGLNTNAINNGKKYFDISSNFRNKKLYPNPCDFVMDINAPIRDSPPTALDPIILAFPYEANLTSGGSTVLQIALSVASSNIRNFYRGSYLEIGGEFRRIISYDAFTQVATVDIAFSAAPPALTNYTIRKILPKLAPNYVNSTGIATGSLTQVRLNAGASAITGEYVNYYIFLPGVTPPSSYQYSRILSYDGPTRVATLASSLTGVVAAGTNYEILEFSRDNVVPLKYSGNQTINNPILLKISLIYVTVPNRYLANGYGGLLSDYNYIYVALYSGSSKTSNYTLYSNNPYSSLALFKVPVTFLRNIIGTQTFLTLNFTGATQTISFRERDTLHFTLFLPDGQVISYLPYNPNSYFPDYTGVFPIEADPVEQITACFEIDPKI